MIVVGFLGSIFLPVFFPFPLYPFYEPFSSLDAKSLPEIKTLLGRPTFGMEFSLNFLSNNSNNYIESKAPELQRTRAFDSAKPKIRTLLLRTSQKQLFLHDKWSRNLRKVSVDVIPIEGNLVRV